MNSRHYRSSAFGRRTALALAIGLGAISGGAMAQSNVTGSIFGNADGHAGGSVTISNPQIGFTRTVPVDSAGRYRMSQLPPGTYTVTLQDNGSTVSTRDNVLVTISGGSEVSFGGASATQAATLEGVSVSAAVLPSIDVSSVDTRTVLTAEQLNKLPIARDVLAAAQLAPGVIANSSYTVANSGGVPSFGGSAASENAYFINGYAVTNPLTAIGLTQLPFDSIDQQQVLTGGYGAEFGRSTGGVINIVTKRGTNEWHGGVYTIWEPEFARAQARNSYYPDTGFYPTTTDGSLYQYNRKNKYYRTTYGVYASGPLIKDKLFFYVDAEMTKRDGQSVGTAITSTTSGTSGWNEYKYEIPRWNAKVDWNVTDDHHLEFTGISDKSEYTSQTYGFNYADQTHGATQNSGVYTKNGGDLYIGKYTGYITDDLTVSALYGKQKVEHIQLPYNYNPACPYISATQQARAPGQSYIGCQTYGSTVLIPGAQDKTNGWRLDVEYRIGDHDIKVGADRQNADSLTGTSLPGTYGWYYGVQTGANGPTTAIDAGHGIGAPATYGGLGTQGYYVYRNISTTAAHVKTEQESQYIEDRWQLTDRWLLSLGLRNEQFTNFNGDNKKFASQRHQLAPRLGASWDVFGDSTLKVYANAGRYHLAMPNNVAVRAASGSLQTQEYFTYTGVVNGIPQGLNAIPANAAAGYVCSGNAISSNLECGDSPDPRTVAAKGLKSHYQDEYIAGFDHAFLPEWNWGAKFTWRKLRSAIDDTCTPVLGGRCFLFNPGQANEFQIENDDGTFSTVSYNRDALGLGKLKRKYYAMDLYLEHPFADKWYGRLDYTFSRSYGNTEGQLASDLDIGTGGQADVSVTQDWDLPQLMIGANGRLPNDHTHQIKAFGYYQVTDDFRVGANAQVVSGRPKNCTSFYPTADRGLYNNAYYYWCGLPGTAGYERSPRGTHGSAPWTYLVNLNVAYTPSWLDKNLTLQFDVLNVLNKQTPTAYNARYATSRTTVNQQYDRELNYTDPRSMRFTVRYDF